MQGWNWDIFCRVIDNHGDLGVCWRLAADLASRGQQVRLWVDDDAALAWMAPRGAPGVRVLRWQEPLPDLAPGEVVVEAFGCNPPERFIARMRDLDPPPCWINLEYLSAEDYVERSHGLPSPQLSGPGAGLTKWFFYPGFTPATGGLLRESDLARRLQRVDPAAVRAAMAPGAAAAARHVLLFCYDNPALPAWLSAWRRGSPTVLWAMPGPSARQARAWQATVGRDGSGDAGGPRLDIRWPPYVEQPRFDELLAAADLNLVRGEDSLVRALWAARPLVWHIYSQADGAHEAKLEAFLDRYTEDAPVPLAAFIRAAHRAWNGLGPAGGPAGSAAAPAGPEGLDGWPWAPWIEHARRVAGRLARRPDLGSELLHFVAARLQQRNG